MQADHKTTGWAKEPNPLRIRNIFISFYLQSTLGILPTFKDHNLIKTQLPGQKQKKHYRCPMAAGVTEWL